MTQEIIQAIQRLQAAQMLIAKYEKEDMSLSVDVSNNCVLIWVLNRNVNGKKVHKGFMLRSDETWEPIGKQKGKYKTRTILSKVGKVLCFDI